MMATLAFNELKMCFSGGKVALDTALVLIVDFALKITL